MKDDPKQSDDSSSHEEEQDLYEEWRELRQRFGEERWKLYTTGLLRYPLWQLIPLLMHELGRGLTGGKDRSSSDVPQEGPGAALVEASDGRKVWIKPDAYRDEEGHLRTEVREHYSRTDGAIWAALAVFEGGEGVALKGEVANESMNPANERLLECAKAAAYYYRANLDALPEPERQEIVLNFARKLHLIAKATREFQEYGERGRVGHLGDPVRDVLAWELHQQGLSWVEIGHRLGIPQTEWDERKNDNQNARKAAGRGSKLKGKAYKVLNKPPS